MGCVDFAKMKGCTPAHAEGHVSLALTDPLTGKIKEKIDGKNYVFNDALFSNGMGASVDWFEYMNRYPWMCLNDSTKALDTTFPYLLGQTIGYGIPSTSGSGLYRGAYNAANQVLGLCTAEKARWKYQYDFTTAQANGTIRNIGLTTQYKFGRSDDTWKICPKGFRVSTPTVNYYKDTNDGSFIYHISSDGILIKHNTLTSIDTTINISSIVGASGEKCVGYDTYNEDYYVWSYGTKTMYKFTDNTFSVLSTTYSCSNITVSLDSYPLYICGDYAYWLLDSTDAYYRANFISNTAQTSERYSGYNVAAYAENSGSGTYSAYPRRYSLGIPGTKYWMNIPLSDGKRGVIFDMKNNVIAGYITGSYETETNGHYFIPTNTDLKIPCFIYNRVPLFQSAITTYVLETPFTKTSANGMTATYELEVFW